MKWVQQCLIERVPSLCVGASYDAQTASVLCVSPPGLLGEASVHVALNGQQYSQHSHTRPAPRIMYYDALPRALRQDATRVA